ncbi:MULTISPECIES: SIS domain-containing protein [Methanobacterium]|jgi:glucosamine--fructose-6-phosphate aminotransferase (isomerizing)|uniref:SIS domain-containing protein n=1 Tax=Methanobacterium veterum TaxID=408577 RepID=A0A9E5A2E5_9EURY|nr:MULTISPECIES: SIS domain-containing protein [Methanobacterium]MCZ3366830.1 SIS domain-containing protein [Methanobacterium veterum]MCZ3374023.1 SIS domain-containing protein [Methanobacterium veterum]
MKYKMYDEIIEQPRSLKDTLSEEKSHMKEIAEKFEEFDKIYLLGCGSSLSTCYSAKSALDFISDKNIEVYTGYEFFYNKKIENENAGALLTSQSGETADTVAALRMSQQKDIYTVAITNESQCTMIKEADDTVITRGGRESAILGTKTYVTQLMSLYEILFSMNNFKDDAQKIKKEVLGNIEKLPSVTEDLIKKTEGEGKEIAEKFKDDDIFYCMGSGPNYGLAYKLAMTMFMEGALKHACPLYSGEFRHGLIERAEKDVPIVFLNADYPGDDMTTRSIEFCEKLGTKSLVYNMKDYSDMNPLMSPFSLVIPLEWFIYYLADFNNEDPGATRHIGKVRY